MKAIAILGAFALLPLTMQAQTDGFITPNFGCTYTEQQALFDEQMENATRKGEFHATVEAGVVASFGRNNPWAGGMFYTGVSGDYFRRVTQKLTLSAGFDLYNYMGTVDATTLGVHALAHYQFNDRLDGSLYVEHNFGNLRGTNVPFNPALGYSMYNGGLYGMNRFNPSTTVAGQLGWTTKRGSRIDIGFSFTHVDRRNDPFGLRRHDFVGRMPTFY